MVKKLTQLFYQATTLRNLQSPLLCNFWTISPFLNIRKSICLSIEIPEEWRNLNVTALWWRAPSCCPWPGLRPLAQRLVRLFQKIVFFYGQRPYFYVFCGPFPLKATWHAFIFSPKVFSIHVFWSQTHLVFPCDVIICKFWLLNCVFNLCTVQSMLPFI